MLSYQISFDRPEFDSLMKFTQTEKKDENILYFTGGNYLNVFLNKMESREKSKLNYKCIKSRIYVKDDRRKGILD